jgi:RNA polymerase sigma-70 factor (ECF subfamily)
MASVSTPPANRDRAGVEALWRESAERLRSWFARRTVSASDADDLVQETFLRVQQHLATLQEVGSARAWLMAIARNTLADLRRQQARERPDGAAPESSESAAAAARSDDQPEELERVIAGWIEGFLSELEPEDAAVLRAVDLDGLTQKELAERLSLSTSGAKSRVQRARTRLRERLEACCAFAFDARGGLLSAERRPGGNCPPRAC